MENYLHHRIVLIPGIRRSAAVIATTRAVMEEIQPYLADGCRRIIAPLGVDTAFSPLPFESENQQAANPTTGNPTPGAGVSARDVPNLTSDERVSRFLHLHTHPFVLFVGNLERRKGLELLLDASALLHQSHPTLTVVMAGKDRGLREKLLKDIDRLKLCEVVILPGFVQAPDLLDLYRHAAVVVQPSLAEGFGIPPLEAMACGAPVVAVDSPALRENLGDAALFSAADATSLAGALARVLDDGSYRRRLIENGLRVSSHFTWERTTEAIRTAITG
jgi:glycosyltransferase involved in cell wall biosynthesis